jgi:hypothetical protein
MHDDALPSASVAPLFVPAVVVGRESTGRDLLIPPAEVLYYFLARATLLIRSAWSEQWRLKSDRVYLRTREHVLRSRFRALGELAERLRDPGLVRVNQGVLVNLSHATEINLHERQIGVALAPSRTGAREIEWITISKRRLRPLREHLVLPFRTRPV